MELILKQPAGKPPFIGVLFENEYEAKQKHASIINNYHTHKYFIIFEPIGDRINLTLDCEMKFNAEYKGLKYDSEKLLKFLYTTRLNKEYNFAHIVNEGDKHTVVKSIVNFRLWVVKVNKLKVLFEH